MSRAILVAASITAAILACLASGLPEPRADEKKDAGSAGRVLKVPDGFVVERVAGPPLVEHPMHGSFDERGRLFVTEAAGRNLKDEELLKELPNSIKVLEPADSDGRFTKAAVFADKMTFPSGVF